MEEPEKKKRKRLKELCKKIRGQMEFYFSDANLHKDRFLKQQFDQSTEGWIDLQVFSKFNKLKSLTTDLELVAKALSTSTLLLVSEDKQQVKRKLPLGDPRDVDDRTIYVECLPLDADHEWVKTVFSQYGNVVYVSLPKYQSSGDIKGFAFVEFQSVDEAKHACEEMKNPSSAHVDTVGKFPTKGCKQIQKLQKQISAQKGKKGGRRTRTVSETEVIDRKAEDAKEEQRKKSGKKRTRLWSQGSQEHESDLHLSSKKFKPCDNVGDDDKKVKDSSSDSSDSSDSDYEPPSVKKSKLEPPQADVGDEPDPPGGGDAAVDRKRKLAPDQNQKQEGETPEKKSKVGSAPDDEDKTKKQEKEKKKQRKRKKKLKEDKKSIPELKVIPKKEWTELRNEYIQLQKSNMKNLKASLKKIKTEEVPTEKEDCGDSKMDASESKENNSGNNTVNKKKGNQLEFTPNVIVHVTSSKSLVRKELKDQLSPHGEVAYIDLVDGDLEAHVRCASNTAAASIAKATVDQLQFLILQGEEEKQYWDKILKDRENKLNSKTKSKKRGKDKAIGRVAMMKEALNKKTHVFFEET